MARLSLKLFFLRTRLLGVSQRDLAEKLGIRQAMVSQLERDRAKPSIDLLRRICTCFDVSADYLLDDSRSLTLLPSDRWRDRVARLVTGMWIEAPESEVVRLDDGKLLVPLLPGESFYDDEAKDIRMASGDESEMQRALEQREKLDRRLEDEVEAELAATNVRRGLRKRRGGAATAPREG